MTYIDGMSNGNGLRVKYPKSLERIQPLQRAGGKSRRTQQRSPASLLANFDVNFVAEFRCF